MKAAPIAVISGTLLLALTGCSSSGTTGSKGTTGTTGSDGALQPPGAVPTSASAPVPAPAGKSSAGTAKDSAGGDGGDSAVTPKTAVDAFLAAAKKGDTSAVATATCHDMKDEVATNLKGLTIQSYTLAAPYQMEDHWVVTATFAVTQNGTPYQGKVDYQVVKESGTYKWCGLDVPFGAPKGTPGVDPSAVG